ILEIMPPGEVVPKIKAISLRALAINPSQAEAHASFAGTLAWEWKTVEAEAEYQVGLRSNPNSPAVHHAYSVFLAAHSEFDRALAHVDRSIALEPLSANHRVARAVILYWARRYSDSMNQAREAIELA